MPSIFTRSLSFRQIGAMLVIPVMMASFGLGCSKARQDATESATAATAVSISTEPVSVEVIAPESATFSVVAEGTNLSYQWQRDGVDIKGATSDTYTLSSTKIADNGAKFKVNVSDANGQSVASAEAVLSVLSSQDAPVITSFTSSPSTTSAGAFTLSWVVSNASELSIDNGVGVVTGESVEVTPTAATTYTLTAKNSLGSVTKSVTVTPGDDSGLSDLPMISVFSASPSSISSGQSTTLSWTISNATEISIDNGIGTVTGNSVTMKPTKTTLYTLTATNDSGPVTAMVQVTVDGKVKVPGNGNANCHKHYKHFKHHKCGSKKSTPQQSEWDWTSGSGIDISISWRDQEGSTDSSTK